MCTKIAAEIGINANGDLNIAKKLIDVAKLAGCDYVKFQKRDIDSCYTEKELNSFRESPFGNTFRKQKEGLEFSFDDYKEIDIYCRSIEIEWFASPWDIKSIDFLNQFDIPFIKIPSAKITDFKYLRKIKSNVNCLIILSTGMSTGLEIKKAVDFLEDIENKKLKYILACTSTYPSKPEELNLRYIQMLKTHYPNIRIGFSNHSPSIIFMPMAMILGAKMIECHITLDRSMHGSDQASSIEPEGLRKLVKYIRGCEKALGSGIKKVYASEIPIIEKLRR